MRNKQQYYTDNEAKNLICEIGRRVYNKNFVAANDGNISIKVGPNTIWATPTGVSKGFMTPDMMVKMDLEGNVISGEMKPSSEVKMHLRVYNENPEVNAVVHAHPPVATSFAIAGVSLDKPISPEAVVLLGTVPVAPYATPGTQEVPDSIAPFCKDYNAVLLANHGALTWGSDIIQAYFRMESLEHYALMLMYSNNIINKANELNPTQISDLINIRKSMGIQTGGVPQSSLDAQRSKILNNKEEMIEHIVRKVTEEVVNQLMKENN
ncbi:class II aldolase/adducin family protein [Cytobacillus massiliigabonensis]|uniref:class II aldolase/adducin family protein n=1 Tax=Cytobacillus massiliigabonensis TaxID=1871011 RepID=UPI000C84F893|nr:class II aldolase/adducin family protein [Cytobacillus massiliigabonensis]